MSSYGAGIYNGGPYGGGKPPFVTSDIPVLIEHFDNTLGYLGAFQTGVGDFIGTEFTVDESGSRDFTLFFGASQVIKKTDIIKIKLFGADDYFFTGVVRDTPISGSTKSEYNYSGFGLNDYLFRINGENQSFLSKTIAEILNSLVDNIIVPKTPIKKNTAKIKPPAITIGSFTANYTQFPEVLDTLINIANSSGDIYSSGVDETGEFFFLPLSTEIKKVLVVGAEGENGISEYEPQDEFEARTKLFILDDNGNLITTLSSTEDNDIWEEKVLAPQLDNADAAKWAQGILAEKEINRRRASLRWKIEERDPQVLLANGAIRIISTIPPISTVPPSPNPFGSGTFGSGLFGGGQIGWEETDDELLIKEVKYVLNGSESIRNIELGAIPVRLDDEVKKIRKNIQNLEINIGR